MALVSSANPASGVVEIMGIRNSSIRVLAVGTSFASPTMTHEEADYYMVCGRIVGAAGGGDNTHLRSPFDLFVKGCRRRRGWLEGAIATNTQIEEDPDADTGFAVWQN